MSALTPINDRWETFKKMCYPDGMTPEQERQLRNAFFAGSLATFLHIQENCDIPRWVEDIAVNEFTNYSQTLGA